MFTWPDASKMPGMTTDLGHDHSNNTIRTDMDSGQPRQRMRFTSGWRTMPVSWSLDNTQYAVFQAIFKYKLNQGADWFEMPVPMGDPADAEEEVFEIQVVRFVGGFKTKYKDVMHWTVTATIESENTSPMTESELDAYLA